MNEFGMGFQMNERYKTMSECNERKITRRERNGMSLERGFKGMEWREINRRNEKEIEEKNIFHSHFFITSKIIRKYRG